jgi:hypothetical protein
MTEPVMELLALLTKANLGITEFGATAHITTRDGVVIQRIPHDWLEELRDADALTSSDGTLWLPK